MRILIWHVHGSYMTALVQGPHTYLIPVNHERNAEGRGRARTWNWPEQAQELPKEQMQQTSVDLVILQRVEELDSLAEDWLGGRKPGRDIPAIFLEHNAPQGTINEMRHPTANRKDLLLVHVTYFNQLFWNSGTTATRVIEHGIVDPGYQYTGELERTAVVINEPLRRNRVTGTDLLQPLSQAMPLDIYGMNVAGLMRRNGYGGENNPPQFRMHNNVARHRAYAHPMRWTSLGLSLLEAMHLGMPVVALGTTEAFEAIPAGAGVVSNRLDVLVEALAGFRNDHEMATVTGKRARSAALERFGLDRFLQDWNSIYEEVTA